MDFSFSAKGFSHFRKWIFRKQQMDFLKSANLYQIINTDIKPDIKHRYYRPGGPIWKSGDNQRSKLFSKNFKKLSKNSEISSKNVNL